MGLRGHKAAVVSSGLAVRFLVALMGPTHVAFPSHWVRGIVTPAEGARTGMSPGPMLPTNAPISPVV